MALRLSVVLLGVSAVIAGVVLGFAPLLDRQSGTGSHDVHFDVRGSTITVTFPKDAPADAPVSVSCGRGKAFLALSSGQGGSDTIAQYSSQVTSLRKGARAVTVDLGRDARDAQLCVVEAANGVASMYGIDDAGRAAAGAFAQAQADASAQALLRTALLAARELYKDGKRSYAKVTAAALHDSAETISATPLPAGTAAGPDAPTDRVHLRVRDNGRELTICALTSAGSALCLTDTAAQRLTLQVARDGATAADALRAPRRAVS